MRLRPSIDYLFNVHSSISDSFIYVNHENRIEEEDIRINLYNPPCWISSRISIMDGKLDKSSWNHYHEFNSGETEDE